VGTVALAPRAIALVTIASVSRSITGAMWRANRSGEMSTISGTVRPYAQRPAGQPPAGRRRPDRRRPWWLSARSAGPAPPTAALASRKPGQTSAVAAPAALTAHCPALRARRPLASRSTTWRHADKPLRSLVSRNPGRFTSVVACGVGGCSRLLVSEGVPW